ncbi:YdeI/OmpD-associated family protein, partial [Myxococcota bacterium]|nr:YdeI/OmpD-associated family protein [Myxococcota bacterium]
VLAHRALVPRLLAQAVELERAGVKVEFQRGPAAIPAELQALLDADPALRAAFDALTPGRQRSHTLHVDGAKTPAARASRAHKCAEKIRAGKGFLDR